MTPETAALELGGDRGAPVLDVDEGVLLHPDHARVERQRRPASHVLGTPGERGVESLLGAIVERQHVVLDRLRHEGRLQLLELVGMLAPRRRWNSCSLPPCCTGPTCRRRKRSCAVSAPTTLCAGSRRTSRPCRCRGCRRSRSTASCAPTSPARRRTSYIMLTPSIGFWATPLTVLGCGSPAAASTVGAMSIRW